MILTRFASVLFLASVSVVFAEETPTLKPQPLTLVKAARLVDTAASVVRENQALLSENEKKTAGCGHSERHFRRTPA